MYVCLCNGITESDIRKAAEAGCSSLPELTMRTGVGACCGSCVEAATEVLERAQPALPPRELDLPLLAVARAA
ncbi:bacterioferritin-associated ferredoxin [Luteimonas sp. RD2P54]|uniref:Bacterioferritin-associated ferredoxin n=1 Tax=Luteimonas endophytica TaxID=3042023 RepID=A0ABT6JE53_9GAMM|nr:bacterioferritin-associated ferredoxin [Luteimonas endophytica]MDH5824887.1 bacterioferritin-associated ferredoxin [Luteimonas endophytica]